MTEGIFEFEVTLIPGAGHSVVAIAGDIDLATSPRLEAIVSAVTGPIVFDLRDCKYIDSTGLRVIAAQHV